MKLIGGILIILASSMLGVHYSELYVLRGKALKSVREIITNLKGEIRYNRTDLIEGFEIVSKKCNAPYKDMLNEVVFDMKNTTKHSFSDIWEKNVNKYLCSKGLNKGDIEQLIELSGKLGYLDYEMQLNSLEHYLLILDRTIEENRNDINDKCKIIRSLGLLIGIMVFIVIV